MTLYSPELTPETGKIGEGRIKQTKRVREMNLLQHRNLVPGAQSGRGRRPLAHPVHRQDHRVLKGRWKEGRGRVAQVVLRKQQPAIPIKLGSRRAQLLGKLPFLKQLVLYPQWHR